MTITAQTLLEAADLLKEVASGEAETCIRASLVKVGALLQAYTPLFEAGTYMQQFAHGLTSHTFAAQHLETITEVARSIVVFDTNEAG